MGYRTDMCLCETKYQGGGCIAPYWGSAHLPQKISRDMGYRSDSIAVSHDGATKAPESPKSAPQSVKRVQKRSFGLFGLPQMGFKRWGFKQIGGYLRKKAFCLRFLDFPGALRTLRKRAKKAEKGRKRPILADFREGQPDTP